MADTFPRQYARTRRFTLGQPRAFTIFPDRVLFLRSLSGSDPRMNLWVLDLATGDERRLIDPAGLADDGDLPIAERARRERVRETSTGVVSYAADACGRVVAFPLGGHLWVTDVQEGWVRRLDTAPGVYDPRPDPTGTTSVGIATLFLTSRGSAGRQTTHRFCKCRVAINAACRC